jgi:hypothetical protein
LYPELANLSTSFTTAVALPNSRQQAIPGLKVSACVSIHNKHKNTDTYCRINCNAADYPELLTDDGKWYFNTSIAEQINVWLGGYYSICKEMLPVKYDFFLDKMVRLRNTGGRAFACDRAVSSQLHYIVVALF